MRSEDPIPLEIDHSWRFSAACDGADMRAFFPEDSITPQVRARREEYALAICAECTVTKECLEAELIWPQSRDVGGIRGGKTWEQRKAIRKDRKNEP